MMEDVVLMEGESVNISCTSTGLPVPTISWMLNNQTTPFNKIDTLNDIYEIMSTLHIVRAQYPAHNGIYECIGTSTHNEVSSTDSIMITVQVQGELSMTAWLP